MKKILLIVILLFAITSFSQTIRPAVHSGGAYFGELTTTQRDLLPTRTGYKTFIFNSTTDQFEWYDGAAWQPLGGGSGDMLKSIYDIGNNGIIDNAEALNGIAVTQLLRSDTQTTKTAGNFVMNDYVRHYFGTGLDAFFIWDSNNMRLDMNDGNFEIRDGATDRFIFERTSGELELSGVKTPTGTGLKLFKDDGTLKDISDFAVQVDLLTKQDSIFTDKTGTVIDLSRTSGNLMNLSGANGTAIYTLQGAVTGGHAILPISTTGNNVAAFPSVTGASLWGGSEFETATNYQMEVWDYGAIGIKYWFIRTDSGGGGGVSDHTLLTNIGTNTHAQIDTHLTNNTGTNTGDQDLSGYVDLATEQTITETKNFTKNIILKGDKFEYIEANDDNSATPKGTYSRLMPTGTIAQNGVNSEQSVSHGVGNDSSQSFTQYDDLTNGGRLNVNAPQVMTTVTHDIEYPFASGKVALKSDILYMHQHQSRVYCLTDNSWAGLGNYGLNNQNIATSKGTGATPTHLDNDIGMIQLPDGAVIDRVEVMQISVSAEITDMDFQMSAIGTDITTETNGLVEDVILAPTSLNTPTTVSSNGVWTSIDLDYTLTDNKTITYAFKPVGTLTATRYMNVSIQVYYSLP